MDWANKANNKSLIIVRPWVVIGEGKRGNIYTLIDLIRKKRFIMVGKGKNRKAMAYVGNLAKFLVRSAVGPRPERPEFVEELAKEIPFYRVRHAVKPGMAGWGLVKQGYSASKVDALVKLQYDLYYIKHQSLWFDLVILLKTVFDTLTFRGRA